MSFGAPSASDGYGGVGWRGSVRVGARLGPRACAWGSVRARGAARFVGIAEARDLEEGAEFDVGFVRRAREVHEALEGLHEEVVEDGVEIGQRWSSTHG
jgi:hypothetical protein